MSIDVKLPKFDLIMFVNPISDERDDYGSYHAFRTRYDTLLAPVSNKRGGVYFIYSGRELLYVGRSNTLKGRIASHLKRQTICGRLYRQRITRISIIYENEQYRQEIYETFAIRKFIPTHNADKKRKDGGGATSA